MSYSVHLTNTKTLEERTYRMDMDWEPAEGSEYLWSEGQFACDCNRGIFFCYAAGENDTGTDCGYEVFAVRITDDEGVELYSDD